MKKSSSDVSVSPRQIWAVAVLLMLIIIAVACWRLLPSLHADHRSPPEQTRIDWEENTNEDIPTYPSKLNNSAKVAVEESKKTGDHPAKLFVFDPNTAGQDELVQLGLSPKVARTIINYRNKGGKFYKKEDLSKIYTLSDDDFRRLLPYIKIADRRVDQDGTNTVGSAVSPVYDNNKSLYPSKSNKPVTINSATAEELMNLNGIGPGYAGRIIKYREILGGYYKVEQLKEVYGMTDSLYGIIRPLIIIDKEHINKLDVNKADEATLYKHPYIRKMAKHIIAYRNEIDGFTQIEEFKQVPLINDEIYRKIVPYLKIRN